MEKKFKVGDWVIPKEFELESRLFSFNIDMKEFCGKPYQIEDDAIIDNLLYYKVIHDYWWPESALEPMFVKGEKVLVGGLGGRCYIKATFYSYDRELEKPYLVRIGAEVFSFRNCKRDEEVPQKKKDSILSFCAGQIVNCADYHEFTDTEYTFLEYTGNIIFPYRVKNSSGDIIVFKHCRKAFPQKKKDVVYQKYDKLEVWSVLSDEWIPCEFLCYDEKCENAPYVVRIQGAKAAHNFKTVRSV